MFLFALPKHIRHNPISDTLKINALAKLQGGIMTDDLKRFLQSDELDKTLQLARQATTDDAMIRPILEQWNDTQAIANLLMHPKFIPDDLRKDTLMRGLNEPMNYLTLAAIVGLQKHVDDWAEDERVVIVKRLQDIMFGAKRMISERASVTLLDYVQESEVDAILLFLGAPEDVVQHNVWVALTRLLEVDEILARVETAFEVNQVTQVGYDFAQERAKEQRQDDLPLLSYIPNLKDFS